MSGLKGLSKLVLGAALMAGICAQAEDTSMLESARTVASEMPAKLQAMLMDEIAKGGPASAVAACSEKAPKMAKAASEKTGWTIRRVSLGNRNPKAVPDAWERSALVDFDRRSAAGEAVTTLEKYAVLEEGGRKEFRYMKALQMQKTCLVCHGAADAIAPEVAEKIHALYPDDKATGYVEGQLRGAITMRRFE